MFVVAKLFFFKFVASTSSTLAIFAMSLSVHGILFPRSLQKIRGNIGANPNSKTDPNHDPSPNPKHE